MKRGNDPEYNNSARCQGKRMTCCSSVRYQTSVCLLLYYGNWKLISLLINNPRLDILSSKKHFIFLKKVHCVCISCITSVRLQGNSCCSILSHFTGQCIREPFHWGGNGASPFLSPGCNRGGSPEPALPGLHLPQSR